jgi:hypothetical protein
MGTHAQDMLGKLRNGLQDGGGHAVCLDDQSLSVSPCGHFLHVLLQCTAVLSGRYHRQNRDAGAQRPGELPGGVNCYGGAVGSVDRHDQLGNFDGLYRCIVPGGFRNTGHTAAFMPGLLYG